MPSCLNQDIGSRLRHARRLYGYRSARSFAQLHDIPESTYSQHETGKRALSPELIVFYCRIFNIDPTWLLMGKTRECNIHTASNDAGKMVPQVLCNLQDLPVSLQESSLLSENEISLYVSSESSLMGEGSCDIE